VEPDHLRQVHVGERVTRDHEERVVPQGVLGVLDAARGAQRAFLGGVLQPHADVLAVAEVVPHQGGEELDGDDRLLEAMFLEQPQDVLHNGPVRHG